MTVKPKTTDLTIESVLDFAQKSFPELTCQIIYRNETGPTYRFQIWDDRDGWIRHHYVRLNHTQTLSELWDQIEEARLLAEMTKLALEAQIGKFS